MTHLSKFFKASVVARGILLTSVVALSSIAVVAQVNKHRAAAVDDQPIFNDYRGVQIGWLADEVRKKLGEPANKGDEQDVYVFGEKELAQILYDKTTRKVITISVDFSSGATGVLTPQQVFGAEIEAKPDGSKYKLVRYPKAGYWLSYSRTAGDTPTVSVTITRIVNQ
ncbi:MAG TPA: hypothetical protein VF074_02040 [Pyrinomonadaceae bacterium]